VQADEEQLLPLEERHPEVGTHEKIYSLKRSGKEGGGRRGKNSIQPHESVGNFEITIHDFLACV
jgi:hypothetical protein